MRGSEIFEMDKDKFDKFQITAKENGDGKIDCEFDPKTNIAVCRIKLNAETIKINKKGQKSVKVVGEI